MYVDILSIRRYMYLYVPICWWVRSEVKNEIHTYVCSMYVPILVDAITHTRSIRFWCIIEQPWLTDFRFLQFRVCHFLFSTNKHSPITNFSETTLSNKFRMGRYCFLRMLTRLNGGRRDNVRKLPWTRRIADKHRKRYSATYEYVNPDHQRWWTGVPMST